MQGQGPGSTQILPANGLEINDQRPVLILPFRVWKLGVKNQVAVSASQQSCCLGHRGDEGFLIIVWAVCEGDDCCSRAHCKHVRWLRIFASLADMPATFRMETNFKEISCIDPNEHETRLIYTSSASSCLRLLFDGCQHDCLRALAQLLFT